jgi:hypothetical protein
MTTYWLGRVVCYLLRAGLLASITISLLKAASWEEANFLRDHLRKRGGK